MHNGKEASKTEGENKLRENKIKDKKEKARKTYEGKRKITRIKEIFK
jgi:hypothetical protein